MSSTFAKKLQLDLLSGSILRAALLREPTGAASFTANATTDTLTTTTSNFVNGTRVRASNIGGALPSPMDSSPIYRVINVVNNAGGGQTFSLSIEANFNKVTNTGTALNLTSAGSGTNNLTEQLFDTDQDNLATLVRWEVTNYQGSGRQSVTAPAATISGTTVQIAQQTFTFSPTSGPITYRYILLIRSGLSNGGDATGDFLDLFDEGGTETIAPGSTLQVKVTPRIQ